MNFQTAVYMPKLSRTEMLSTVPGSKFQGASFLTIHQKDEISNGYLHTKIKSYRNVEHRSR